MTFKAGEPRAPNSGRRKGTPNKLTEEVRKLAKQYAPTALRRLNEIATQEDDERAAVAACREILERAYGRSSTPDESQAPSSLKIVITGDDAKL